ASTLRMSLPLSILGRLATPKYPEHMERTSESGLPVDPVYDASKLTDFRPEEKLGRPGEYPVTRGVYPRMYVDRPWTMRQYAGFATPQESNQRRSEEHTSELQSRSD